MRYISLLVFCLVFSTTNAQNAKVFEIDHTISSAAFGDEREITIYLPPAFYEDSLDKYIVTYILDGHYDPFVDTGVKILEYFSHNYKITPTIVVGIHAKQRGREFNSSRAWDDAQSEILMAHLEKEVIPTIEKVDFVEGFSSRLLPYRTLIGHSSGGTFVLDHLFSSSKDVFNAYVAISPGLREDQYYVFADAEKMLREGRKIDKFLYCSTGTVGEREKLFGKALDSLDFIIDKYKPSELSYKRETIQGTGHWTCVPTSFANGMVNVTRNIRVDEYLFEEYAKHKTKTIKELVDGFYKEKEALYGFIEIPKARYIGRIAQAVHEDIDQGKGLDIIEWGITQYPDNVGLSKNKISFLIEANKMDLGRAEIKRGKDVLEKVKLKLTEDQYNDQLKYFDRMIKKIEE